jgi:hypothetical protein
MEWIKAIKRLPEPEMKGIIFRNIITGKVLDIHSYWSEKYLELNDADKIGKPVGTLIEKIDVEWLDESKPLSVTSNVEELAAYLEKYRHDESMTSHRIAYKILSSAGKRPVDAVELAKEVWAMTMAYANNLCIQLANAFNSDDEIEKATAASGCALKIRTEIDDPHPDIIKYAQQFQPPATLSASIIEALEKANPYLQPFGYHKIGYSCAVSKLRELISSQPPNVLDGIQKSLAKDWDDEANYSISPSPDISLLIESLKECDDYLNQHHFAWGIPVYPNNIGANSILHTKIKHALSQYNNNQGKEEKEEQL